MTHFLSPHRWGMYNETGIQISQRQLKGWAGRQNQLKIIVGDFLSVFCSRQDLKCQVWKNTVLLAKILLITRLRIMSLFCNYCRIGLAHVICVGEICVSSEIGSINVRHSSEVSREILCLVIGNTW